MNSGMVVVAACLLLGFSVICADETVTPSLVPMFLWSNNPYFTGSHNTVSESLRGNDIHSLLSQLVTHKETKTKINSFVNGALKSPEVLLSFVYPELSSGEASRIVGGYSPSSKRPDSFLKTAVTSSSSSLSIPYVLTDGSISEELVNIVSLNPNSQLIASEIESDKSGLTGCDALLNHLSEERSVFSNGITDLILVHYDHTKDNVKCMERIINHVDRQTNGKYVSLLSADKSSAKPIQMVFADGSESAHFEREPLSFTEFAIDSHPGKFQTLATGYTPVVYVGVQYVTPNTMVALFLGFFMVFVIYTGAMCVMYIETPVRFSATPLQLSKEY